MDKVLFIDDEVNILNSIRRILRKEPYQTFIANGGAQALDILKDHPDIAVVISDFRMPYMSGSEFLEQVNNLYPQTIRMILSGYADKENIIETINKGHIYKFLVKPWDDVVLKSEIIQALSLFHNITTPKGLEILLNETINGIIITDVHYNLIQLNQYVENMLGQNYNQKINKNIFLEQGAENILGPSNLHLLIEEKFNQNQEWTGEGYLINFLQEKIPLSIHVKKFRENLKSKPLYLYQLIDLSKQKAIEKEIHHRYHLDEATGLLNRSAIIDDYTHHFKNGTFSKITLFKIDCCRFEEINKIISAQDSQILLKYIIKKIQQVIQDYLNIDLYYLNKGRFGLMIKNSDHGTEEKIADTLCHLFKIPYENQDSKIPININIAISCFPNDGSTIESILNNCAVTLNYLRKEGINNYAFYNIKQKIKLLMLSKEDLSFESELYEAMSKEQFIIYYQPFMDFGTNKIFGCEALIRWNHPRLGIVPPDRFIPLLEKTGLIFQVTRWILAKVFDQISVWQHAGFDSIKVSVNLPSNQFRQPGFYKELTDLLTKTKVSASSVELEITESMLMENIDENKVMLEKLRSLGFHLALDDFGTGYSSFSILKTLPFNILKIDRSFIHDIAQYRNSAAILSSMIAMGQSLGMRIIAEGVETDEQIKILKDFNCNYGQGYFFSKPVPADQFFKLLQDSNQEK